MLPVLISASAIDMAEAHSNPAASEVSVGPQGRLVIPAAVRKALGIEAGDTLLLHVSDGSLVLERRDAVLRRMQKRYEGVREGVSLVDELIAERRAEAARERAAGDEP